MEEGRARHIDELISGDGTTVMVMTMIGAEHTSRPVTCLDVTDRRMSFLVPADVDWVQAIAAGTATVHISVSDDKHGVYLSLNGRAGIDTSPTERERLWTPVAKAWFTGPEDPNLRVLTFDVSDGRYWETPDGSIGRAIAMLRSIVTHDDKALGESGPVS
jgi:general stress protein 26